MTPISELHDYKDRLKRCSVAELEDIYFHINIIKHPEQYQAVLDELEFRRIMPEIADRILPDLRWDSEAWVNRFSYIASKPTLKLILGRLISAVIVTLSAAMFFFPFWLLIETMHVLNHAASIIYLLSLPLPIIAAWNIYPPHGKKGKNVPIFIIISVYMMALFFHTQTFKDMLAPLTEPEHSSGGSGLSGLGGF